MGAKLQNLFKYTGVACLIISILPIALSFANNTSGQAFPLMGKVALAEQATDEVNGATYSAPYITLSITNATGGTSTDDGDITLTTPEGGGVVAGRHTITVETNAANGYTVGLSNTKTNTDMTTGSSTTNTTTLSSVSGTQAKPTTLETNTWGYAVPGLIPSGLSTSPFNAASDYNADAATDEGQTTLLTTKYAGVPASGATPDTIMSGGSSTITSSTSTVSTDVYYGARVARLTQAGTYSATVQYTATANLPSAPTITSVEPSTLTAGDSTTVSDADRTITITGTNLLTTYNVYIDLDNNYSASSPTTTLTDNEKCTSITSDTTSPNTKLTCIAPATETAGTYTIYLQTQADTMAKLEDGITYEEPVLTCAGGYTGVSNDGGLCEVDIDSNMIPVVYAGSTSGAKWVKAGAEGDVTDSNGNKTWFNYDKQQWANAVTVTSDSLSKYQAASAGTEISNDDVLGYWVYIPRYEYKVLRYNASDAYVSATNFTITFQKATDTKAVPAQTGDLATHPAFTWGDTELNGFWMGKFSITGTRNAPTVKPNQHANISECATGYFKIAQSIGVLDSTGSSYGGTNNNTLSLTQNSHNLSTATSHMLKNSEWGAVAYLSASDYGAGVNNVQINSAYPSSSADADGTSSRYGITGCGPSSSGATGTYTNGTALSASTIESATACSSDTGRAYNGVVGQLASTTNNTYGVYDMSGGVWEYVAGNYNKATSYGGFTAWPSSTYMDYYMSSTFTGNYYTNNNLCTWATCGGHALHETKTVQSVSSSYQSWGGDISNFVYSSGPWFLRGGYAGSGSNAGVFASSYARGYYSTSVGSRAVLVAPAPAG